MTSVDVGFVNVAGAPRALAPQPWQQPPGSLSPALPGRVAAAGDAAAAPASRSLVPAALAAASVVGIAAKGRRTRRSAVARRAQAKGFLQGLWARLRNKEKLESMEERLSEADRLIKQAADHADNLQTAMEKELEEERDIRAEMQEQISKLSQSYTVLNDNLEMQQVESAQNIEAIERRLAEAAANLEDSHKKEVNLLNRLKIAEEDEKKMQGQMKALIAELAQANQKEKSLEEIILKKDKQAEELAEELKATRAESEGKSEELAKAALREAEFRKSVKDWDEANKKLQKRLNEVEAQEHREEALASELSEAHAGNMMLEAELKDMEKKLEDLVAKKKTKTNATRAKKPAMS